MKSPYLAVTSLLIVLGTVLAMAVYDLKAFQVPELARIVFFHLPAALLSTGYLMFATWQAFQVARSSELRHDHRMAAAMRLAFVLGVLTLVTGSLFSKVQWGAWWNWDPRQTSFLLVMLIVGAFFALRAAIPDEIKAARASAGYALAASLPILFLVFVYPRLPQVVSLHPDVVRQGSMDGAYWGVLLLILAGMLLLTARIYRLDVACSELEARWEDTNGKLDDSGRPAPTGVVRPVDVSGQGGPTSARP
ncbi:MAG: cytochrome c biogenesis protein CcsA [Fimbriimonadaceae bacterium]|uniref:Heme exporter protein C n=1 Tax=Candidatus Nitrosymbiomonas proteolyticus TaxID=2608984 RepID=A0A809R6D9_9BACT|nr:cytochrome c biogenesis protein CcsA [Fimbriimonadaceae bacterium]QOJ11187.1 MAG: cytochrome c biogenesis protein CcsA [Chthonomonadaceae bacterium]BBO23143.1 cytochrome c assembly protein [Candidatus Nitrosymbiomonas proteolyticus]